MGRGSEENRIDLWIWDCIFGVGGAGCRGKSLYFDE